MSDITIIIPTSPIPSHPSTEIIDETIFNTRQYTDAEILILFDGVHESLAHRTEQYNEYIVRVIENIESGKYGNCRSFIHEHHTHQAEMTRIVLKQYVTTPLIFFVEHDTSAIGDIPFKKICDMVKNSSEINYCRFHIFNEFLKEHKHLMLSKDPIVIDGVSVARTIQWSQRPHIAKANWYRDILFNYFDRGVKTMIEDKMHSVVISKYEDLGYDNFGLAIYAPEGNKLRSYTSDGRKTDEKIIYG